MSVAPPSGHIKLARKLFDAEHGDPFWTEKREFSRFEAWVDVIQLAAWRTSRYATSAGVIELARGEFVASRRHLAKRWGWTEKKVRVWLTTVQKGARIRAQRETNAGTVYLITKYDTYQSTPTEQGQAEGPPEGQARAQQGPKIEAVKAVKAVKPSLAGADAPPVRDASGGLAALPKATCDAAYDAWSRLIGAMEYPRFRKTLLPIFTAQPCVYTGEQMGQAVEAFNDAMTGEAPEWRGKWTVNRFAGEIHEWVRLGAMELIDEYGLPTERGRAARILAA